MADPEGRRRRDGLEAGFTVNTGRRTVWVGASSKDLRLRTDVVVKPPG
ncbi:hypothetical protein [Streptomyces sp. TRM68367]|nr:hypothetical protein [Streptomyces sp. TRM68367]MBC9731308.1 hypothetical protein [Streptomyces sp. TRM68367]